MIALTIEPTTTATRTIANSVPLTVAVCRGDGRYGRSVHVQQLWTSAEDPARYRRGAPDSDAVIEKLRGIFGREDGEPLPDLSVFPETVMENETPPGTNGRARIGSAEIEFTVPCPRCVMVTLPVDDEVGEDRRILRHIVRELDQNVVGDGPGAA